MISMYDQIVQANTKSIGGAGARRRGNPRRMTVRGQILAFLRKQERPVLASDIVEGIGCPTNSVASELRRMVLHYEVACAGADHSRGRKLTYTVVDNDNDTANDTANDTDTIGKRPSKTAPKPRMADRVLHLMQDGVVRTTGDVAKALDASSRTVNDALRKLLYTEPGLVLDRVEDLPGTAKRRYYRKA